MYDVLLSFYLFNMKRNALKCQFAFSTWNIEMWTCIHVYMSVLVLLSRIRKWRMKRKTYQPLWMCVCRTAFVKMQMHDCFIYYTASFSWWCTSVYVCVCQHSCPGWNWVNVHGALLQIKSEEDGAVSKVQCIYDSMHNLCNGWTKTHQRQQHT